MLDNNWEMINGPVAHQIEIINATNQINVLNGLLAFLLAHRGPNGLSKPPMPDEAALLDIHRAGTMFLLAEPGCYRNMDVHVGNQATGEVVHQPPPWQYVRGLMQHFFREMSSVWASGDSLDVAAYALWRINWIHPFRNGNGRTARTFAYACLCTHLEVVLPGTTTVIDQIMLNRQGYEAALRAADQSVLQRNPPDLQPMKAYLNELLQIQINSIGSAPPA